MVRGEETKITQLQVQVGKLVRVLFSLLRHLMLTLQLCLPAVLQGNIILAIVMLLLAAELVLASAT